MTAGDFYRIEFRIQNSVRKYYLIREIFTDSKKFSASRLITSGTPPTRRETDRCASLFGFELELKCIAKAAKYRSENFRFEEEGDTDAVFEIERFRLLQARKQQMKSADHFFEYAASHKAVTFEAEEISKMFSSGMIPRGKTLSEVNLVQNLKNAWEMRDGKMPSIHKIVKIHQALSANLGKEALTAEQKTSIEKQLRIFSEKIKDGFYPFEQCKIFYNYVKEITGDEVFSGDIYHMLLSQFGYTFPLDKAEEFEDAVLFAEEENPALEYDIRQLNEAIFTVKTGGKQKQLELF
ncbi:MAG TPA: hypothetical protein O0W80_01940 [Methanocorpusculum sp.]|nr:hypothetical protein [Methanocorpusculum parvum]MBR4117996.1 hypothetical protein [Methanocorpusculum sp.]HJJ67363.1 hypothetical protein [Methanocorpusculum sp.]HJJ72007.1 hypothetical protein [Methanocorpusculum sp.]HJJ74560.1 hypothetical protein [Methanocorpusculum sp.]